MVEQNNHIRINGGYPIVNKVLGLISRHNPITGLFQLSLSSDTERGLVVDLSQGKSITKISFFLICNKVHGLKVLFSSIPGTNNSEDQTSLHPIIISLLNHILRKLDLLLKSPTRKLVEMKSKLDEHFNYFPAFTDNYM